MSAPISNYYFKLFFKLTFDILCSVLIFHILTISFSAIQCVRSSRLKWCLHIGPHSYYPHNSLSQYCHTTSSCQVYDSINIMFTILYYLYISYTVSFQMCLFLYAMCSRVQYTANMVPLLGCTRPTQLYSQGCCCHVHRRRKQ